jgi:hypothetical protein
VLYLLRSSLVNKTRGPSIDQTDRLIGASEQQRAPTSGLTIPPSNAVHHSAVLNAVKVPGT